MSRIAILDVDGTLVDTNYHHAIAWFRAFRRHSVMLEVWRIHRHIGMGGDQLVASLAGDEVEERLGDSIRDAESELYRELIEEVQTMEGSRELIEDLREAGNVVVLALAELLDDLGAERRQVVGLARGDQALVDDDLLVDPVRARVAQVRLHARP